MKTVKWIIAALVPAFVSGSAMLAAGVKPGFEFWFGFAGAFVGGLAGMGLNKGIDKTQGE